jgi:hypothetical protein
LSREFDLGGRRAERDTSEQIEAYSLDLYRVEPLARTAYNPDIRIGLVRRAYLVRLYPKAMLTSDDWSHDGRAAAIRFVQTRRP